MLSVNTSYTLQFQQTVRTAADTDASKMPISAYKMSY